MFVFQILKSGNLKCIKKVESSFLKTIVQIEKKILNYSRLELPIFA